MPTEIYTIDIWNRTNTKHHCEQWIKLLKRGVWDLISGETHLSVELYFLSEQDRFYINSKISVILKTITGENFGQEWHIRGQYFFRFRRVSALDRLGL